MKYHIRKATHSDRLGLVEMAKKLLTHLGNDVENFSEERFIEDAFGEQPQFAVIVAELDDGPLLGYALFHDAYEPSHTERGVYIADLYVTDLARGLGLGKSLLRAVAIDASNRGRTFVWLVSPQEDARSFYDGVMDIRDEMVAYALTGEHFEKLVAG
jgi:GNAT superfamily N-acetyltransferase